MSTDTPPPSTGASAARGSRYVPALRFDVLTPIYDPVVALTTRERTFKSRLLDQADLHAGHRVLDLGCGTGTLAILAARQHPGISIAGVDGDPAVLARARRKSAEAEVHVSFEQAYSTQLPFADQQFDRVLSTLFFHHLATEHKQQTFTEVARVLAPGGQLHIADWGKPTNAAMRLLAWPLQLLDGIEHTADNIAGRLPDYMAAAGLRDVQIVSTLPTAFGTMSLYRADSP